MSQPKLHLAYLQGHIIRPLSLPTTLFSTCGLALTLAATTSAHAQTKKLIDPNATPETVALFRNLDVISDSQILFGHQSATEYGHGWTGEADRSDVKSVSGSHPAVIGLDVNSITGRAPEATQKAKATLRRLITATYNRGGITTLAWHYSNPVTPTGFAWTEGQSAAAVKDILPGGSHHEQYKADLIQIADLARSVRGKDGSLAPLLFRPFHEQDGGWFWWGKPHASREEFIALWRFTVGYLRDNQGVHNLIYTFSPDCTATGEAEFLERYPGDAWVDMLGIDDYADFGRDGKYDLDAGAKKLKTVSDYAKRAGKLAAFTETGLETIPNPTWWTQTLLKTIQSNDLKLSYVLVWRNDSRSATHFYAPFPGQVSVPDFLKFRDDKTTLFEKDLPPLYK